MEFGVISLQMSLNLLSCSVAMLTFMSMWLGSLSSRSYSPSPSPHSSRRRRRRSYSRSRSRRYESTYWLLLTPLIVSSTMYCTCTWLYTCNWNTLNNARQYINANWDGSLSLLLKEKVSCSRWDSNPHHCFSRPVLCPLSYRGSPVVVGQIRQYKTRQVSLTTRGN